MTDNFDYRFTLPLAKRLMMFLCIAVLGFVIAQIIIGFIMYKCGTDSVPAMRICAVIQDVIMFILPAFATAIVISRLPAMFLCVGGRLPWSTLLMAILTFIVAMPAFNTVVAWNESIKFPESMAGLEQTLRQYEEAAQASVNTLIRGNSVPALIVSILIVGVLTGFSEEIFFRGTFQRLLTTGRVNHHVAIWLSAFVFSALHMQVFGFFGRLLLGAYFGYLLYWTRSLWVPILLHAFNNSAFIIGIYASGSDNGHSQLDTVGTGSWQVVLISIALTAAGLAIIYMRSQGDRQQHKILTHNNE